VPPKSSNRKGGILRYEYIFRVSGMLVAFAFMVGIAAAQATVKSETLPVLSRMDTTSDVIGTLKKGDSVVIEMSILGEGNAEWCSIREPAQQRSLGYVRCEYLERPPAPKPAAVPVVPAAPPAAQQVASDSQPALGGIWDPNHPSTLGEKRYLVYAGILAKTFRFSPQQKERVLEIAQRTGIPACIEDTDRYVRKNSVPPDLFRTPTSWTTQCDWNFQAFIEQVFALVSPEQQTSYRASYKRFSDEVAGHRRALELNSRKR
jgi:hypothetical protein